VKFKFENAIELQQGIDAVQEILNFEQSINHAEITVCAQKTTLPNMLIVSRKKDYAKIEYTDKVSFFRGLMLLCENESDDFEIKEVRKFSTNGAMFDMSRNSVFRVSTIKEIMIRMALMGLNTFMLYTEDTYTVEGYVYFGHMRGRYTPEEIKEVVDFGEALGIEVVPCIQLLAHLATALRWASFQDIRDTHDIILTDNEETYKLIDSIFNSLSKMYKSRRIHIGMDEAEFLGRGRYIDTHGYDNQDSIFLRHLQRCREIAHKYGFKPMMWSDMFFSIASEFGYSTEVDFSDEVKKIVPRDVDQVYWAYDPTDEKTYGDMIEKHREISDNVVFAGGIWTWIGPCPAYGKTIAATVPALNACMNHGVKDVIATVWHNGAECPLITSLLGLMIYAEMDYQGKFDIESIKKRFEFICKINADDIMRMEFADHPCGGDLSEIANPSRYLLYNDPLAGLLDKHAEGLNLSDHYRRISEDYKTRGQQDGIFFEAFEYYRGIIKVLELKADFGIRLKMAYDTKSVEALHALYDESNELQIRIKDLKNTHRKSWLYYNKAFGFEVFDMIYGALESRFETLRFQLDRFFLDNGYIIDELGEKRLPFIPIPEGECPAVYIGPRFTRLYSANVTSTMFNDINIG
jgi:hexosaminidase